MGVTGSTGPVMDRDEVDRALARLGAEHEAIETSLLALQDHAGRRLLEGAELTGVTQERWTSTEASITLLWTYFDAYTDALRAARDIRCPSPLVQPRGPGGADGPAERRVRHGRGQCHRDGQRPDPARAGRTNSASATRSSPSSTG